MNYQPSRKHRRSRRALAAGSLAVLALAAGPASAGAADAPTGSAPYCEGTLSQAFTQFGDANWYSLAPGGDIESSLDGWSLSNATVVAGSDPFAVTGTLGAAALQIDAGGVVTTPAVCVDPTRETFRFVVRNVGTKRTRLKVEALFNRRGPRYAKAMTVGYVSSNVGAWAPTPILRNLASKVLAAGTTGDVTYRFTAEGGAMVVDDLHIDPRFKR